jgi:hypothetical protein
MAVLALAQVATGVHLAKASCAEDDEGGSDDDAAGATACSCSPDELAADPTNVSSCSCSGRCGCVAGYHGLRAAIDPLMHWASASGVRVRPSSGNSRHGIRDAGGGATLRFQKPEQNRYLRGYAVEALKRIGLTEPRALAELATIMEHQQWCPFTTPESPF